MGEVGAEGLGEGGKGGEKGGEEKKLWTQFYIFFRTNLLVLTPHTYPPTRLPHT